MILTHLCSKCGKVWENDSVPPGLEICDDCLKKYNLHLSSFKGEFVYVKDGIIKEKYPGFYLYGIRHADGDWDAPATIETRVVVNCWGMLLSEKQLLTEKEQYLELTEEEADEFREAVDHVST